MYLNHYHLESKPFGLSPSPKFLWFGEKHLEALSTLQYGIKEDLGFLLLTGDVGVGKTALIHQLIDNLDSSTIVANITDPKLEIFDFFKALAVEFNITTEFNSKGEFLIELEKFLYSAYREHKKVLLIVDEAQRLNNSLLDQIRVLSNIELSHRKLINIFFIGQPEFKNMLMVDSNRAIRQRIVINYHINPLTESETRRYIEHRLKVAGATRKIFKSNAFREIFRSTGGYPRAINIICDHALLTGYASGLKSIDSGVIKECKRELSTRAGSDIDWADFRTPTSTTWPDTFSPPPRRSPVMGYPLLIGICFVIGIFVSYYFLWPTIRGTMKSMSQQKLAESSNHQADTALNSQLNPSETILKEQAQASSKNETAPAQTPVEKGIPVKAATKDEIAAADLPPVVFSDQAAPVSDKTQNDLALLSVSSDVKPDPQPDEATQKDAIKKQESPYPTAETNASGRQPETSTYQAASASDKTQNDLALLSVSSDVKPEPQPDEATQKVELTKQNAPYSTAETTDADRQPEISTDQSVPAHDSISAKPKVESDGIIPTQAGGKVVFMATLPDAKPKPLTQGEQVNTTTGGSETIQLKSESTKNTQPEKLSSGNRPDPLITAKAETQLQPSKEQTEGTAPSVEQPDSNGLENRLRSFLQNYCSTYAAKDLDEFTIFFAPHASENGKPFASLLPKYQRNFRFIETIQYRIELQQFSYDINKEILKIEGNFFLKWLPPDKMWRENSGIITMSLKENGASFLVQRLDYHSTHSKKSNPEK